MVGFDSALSEVTTVLIASCIAIFLAVYCLFLYFYSRNPANWIPLRVLVPIFLIIFVVLFVISASIRKLVAKRSLLTRCKCFSLIGYGGIALCGIVPRIAVFFFVEKRDYINLYIAYISSVTSFFIYFFLLRPNSKNFRMNYSLNGTTSWFWIHFVLQIIVLLITSRIAFALIEDVGNRGKIIYYQVVYTICFAPSMFDFCQVLRGGAKLKTGTINTENNGDAQKQRFLTGNAGILKEIRDPEPGNKFEVDYENYKKNIQNQKIVAGNKKNVKTAEISEQNFK